MDELTGTYYPYLGGTNAAIVCGFSVKPWPKTRAPGSNVSGDTKLESYDDAEVIVTYTTERVVNAGNGLYFSEQLIPEPGYAVQQSGDGLFWSGGTPLTQQEGPILNCPELKYTLTYYQLPAASINPLWIGYKDTVNSVRMYTKALGLYFEPGFVRYEGAKMQHALSHRGVIQYTVALTWSYSYRNGTGWQGVWRSSEGHYELVYNAAGTQVLIHPQAAFSF